MRSRAMTSDEVNKWLNDNGFEGDGKGNFKKKILCHTDQKDDYTEVVALAHSPETIDPEIWVAPASTYKWKGAILIRRVHYSPCWMDNYEDLSTEETSMTTAYGDDPVEALKKCVDLASESFINHIKESYRVAVSSCLDLKEEK